MSIFYCCCKPRNDYATFLCVLPLALALVLLSLTFGWWGTWEIYSAVSSSLFPNFSTVLLLIFGILRGICAVFGILAVILRSAVLTRWVRFFVDLFIFIVIFEFVYQWVCWILLLCGVGTPDGQPLQPNGDLIATMVIVSVFTLIFLICGYWILGLISSLAKIYEVGGNGWERYNYKEIESSSSSV